MSSNPNQDPSMEEILASIKRVIAEDGKVARPARGSRPAEAPSAETPPGEEMALQGAPLDSFDEDGVAGIEEEDILELDDPVLEGSETLVSRDVADASRQSLAALLSIKDESGSARTAMVGEGPLEAVVREMLRPLLKDWLDRNLPDMVEALVTREIARITGQRL